MAKGKSQDNPKPGPASISNRRARFDYEILESLEMGIVLVGSEVKSVYLGNANLSDSYCMFREGELWLLSADIEPYDKAGRYLKERRRDRKLLAHRKELDTLLRKSQEKSLSIIPLKMYFNHGKVKIEVGLGRGKKQYDKRDAIAKQDTRRELERAQNEKY